MEASIGQDLSSMLISGSSDLQRSSDQIQPDLG